MGKGIKIDLNLKQEKSTTGSTNFYKGNQTEKDKYLSKILHNCQGCNRTYESFRDKQNKQIQHASRNDPSLNQRNMWSGQSCWVRLKNSGTLISAVDKLE